MSLRFEDVLRPYEAIDTSQGTDKNTSHSYASVYNDLFQPIRHQKLSILEIGIDSGASLLAFADFFPNSSIYGLDIRDNTLEAVKKHERVSLSFGDALITKNIFNKFYDIIVEDASHLPDHQVQHFIDFAPFLTQTGIYIIEDIWSDNLSFVRESITPYAEKYGLRMDVIDLRSVKGRFDDILLVFKRKN